MANVVQYPQIHALPQCEPVPSLYFMLAQLLYEYQPQQMDSINADQPHMQDRQKLVNAAHQPQMKLHLSHTNQAAQIAKGASCHYVIH